jgi:predicted GNAT superfamily acetyltransferase
MDSVKPLPDLEIRPLDGWDEYRACVALQELTWGAGFGEAVPPTILRLTQQMGGIAAGAFDHDGRLLGFVFGITGWVDGRPVHWSDMLAVHPDARDRRIGQALKRHQRERLLGRGVHLARWSFEPLEARNARLNLSILGGTARQYVRDYYGDGVSNLHQGIGTDRLIIDWELDQPRVERRLSRSDPTPSAAILTGVPVVNAPHIRSGMPDCTGPDLGLGGPVLAVAVPADIQALKGLDMGRARRWRAVTREAFEAYLGGRYRVVEFVRSGGCGYYVLER